MISKWYIQRCDSLKSRLEIFSLCNLPEQKIKVDLINLVNHLTV
jgi:hypothetical protein